MCDNHRYESPYTLLIIRQVVSVFFKTNLWIREKHVHKVSNKGDADIYFFMLLPPIIQICHEFPFPFPFHSAMAKSCMSRSGIRSWNIPAFSMFSGVGDGRVNKSCAILSSDGAERSAVRFVSCVGDGSKIPLSEGSYDIILLSGSVGQVPQSLGQLWQVSPSAPSQTPLPQLGQVPQSVGQL